MVWRKNNFLIQRALLLLFVLAFGPTEVNAARKAGEPLWRVSNPQEMEVVPPYAGSVSPFPSKKQKQVRRASRKIEEKKPTFGARDIFINAALREKTLRATQILKRIREIVKKKEAFNPDVSNIVIEAKILSRQGPRILIRNQWVGVGEKIAVPIIATDTLFSMIGELELLDPSLASIVEEEFNEQVEQSSLITLELHGVEEDFVEMVDQDGRLHVISFISSGW